MYYIVSLHFLCHFVRLVISGDPPGHLQVIGSHRPGIKIEERLTVPDPVEFFEKYINEEKPVVFKGAAKKFPNFKSWKDDNYLRSNFGNWFMGVEVGKYEGSLFGKRKDVPLRYFLSHYKTKNYYIVQEMSPSSPMRKDIYLLKAMACGGFKETTTRIALLFSYGGTECAMHWDGIDNIHCSMDGSKEWRLFERKALEVLPRMKDYRSYSEFDCRKIDMYKYPMVQDLPWYQAFVETGDCIYVPPDWPHYVVSPPNRRNMGLAVWFGPTARFNGTDCPNDLSELPDILPIGKRIISKLDYSKLFLSQVFGSNLKELSNEYLREKIMTDTRNETLTSTVIDALDSDKNGYVTLFEVMNIKEDFHSFFTSLIKRPDSVYEELHEDWTVTTHYEL